VTGPHLHLIARYGDITVDAMSLIAPTSAAPKPKKNGTAKAVRRRAR
jgi:hypothetical protein